MRHSNHGTPADDNFIVSVLALIALGFVLAWKQFWERFKNVG